MLSSLVLSTAGFALVFGEAATATGLEMFAWLFLTVGVALLFGEATTATGLERSAWLFSTVGFVLVVGEVTSGRGLIQVQDGNAPMTSAAIMVLMTALLFPALWFFGGVCVVFIVFIMVGRDAAD